MMKCPCCGYQIGQATKAAIIDGIDLTETEGRILEILWRAKPLQVPRDDLVSMLYDEKNVEWPYSTLSVHVHNLRQKLETAGYTIPPTSRWNRAYKLVPL